jgi:RNA polymerase sigma-70 factor, ECF subfamily
MARIQIGHSDYQARVNPPQSQDRVSDSSSNITVCCGAHSLHAALRAQSGRMLMATMHPQPALDESELIGSLRAGDEAAFVTLVERYNAGMIRVASIYVKDRATAQEVAQEAWLGVLRGLEGFQARSSLKTWIFRIVLNCARARAVREQRSIPFSAASDALTEGAEPAVDSSRFRGPEDPYHGGWMSFPTSWGQAPEQRVLSGEVRQLIAVAVDQLPPAQREVVVMRDVQGWTADEVCQMLHVSESNQRVLLHRGRSKLRCALAHYLTAE